MNLVKLFVNDDKEQTCKYDGRQRTHLEKYFNNKKLITKKCNPQYIII